MTPHERRLQRLEYLHIRCMAAEVGAPYGFSADEILDEARRYLAQTPEQQHAEMGAFLDSLSPEERAEIAVIEANYRRILRPQTPPRSRRY